MRWWKRRCPEVEALQAELDRARADLAIAQAQISRLDNLRPISSPLQPRSAIEPAVKVLVAPALQGKARHSKEDAVAETTRLVAVPGPAK